MQECIFCKIVNGEIPSLKVYEDQSVLAFLDIAPVNKGHIVVIPKQHCEKLHDCQSNILCELTGAIAKISRAMIAALDCEDYNILCNNGSLAGQVIDHIHFHIIPRTDGDGVLTGWPAGKYETGQAEEILEKIRDYL